MKSDHKKGKKRPPKQKPEEDADASQSDSDVDDVIPNKRKKHKKRKVEHTQTSLSSKDLPRFVSVCALPPLQKNHWTGNAPENPPSDQLKALRKSLNILVKGDMPCPPPVTTLQDAGIPPQFGAIFQQLHLSTPTPVQMQCWPAALAGCNILGIAPTGSGKTLAYSLPLIPHLMSRSLPKAAIPSPSALILAPTRELAIQIASTLKPFKTHCSLYSGAVYGGEDKQAQLDKLPNHLHILVATPGRLLDLLISRRISLENVGYLVIDEADRMLALGFEEQLNMISECIRPDRQSLLYSATFPGKLREVASKWVPDAVIIRVNTMDIKEHKVPMTILNSVTENNTEATSSSSVAAPVEASSFTINPNITQHVHVCATHKKPRLIIGYITRVRAQEKEEKVRQPGPMIIFCTKIKTLKFVHSFLQKQNVVVDMLHGQMPQNQRERVLNDFKAV